MAVIDYDKKEVNAKIVYYGPGLSGKTSNIHHIYQKLMPQHRGELMTLSTKSHRTLFFDFLPVELGEVKGLNTRFYLYTVPGQVFYNNIRKQLLKDVDGIVFVADSTTKMKNENVQSFQNLEENLAEMGRSLKDIPYVIQYNKRDMPDVQSLEDLHRQLNKYNAPFFESVATTGSGVLKALTTISKMVLKRLREGAGLQTKTTHEGPIEAYGLSDDFIAMTLAEADRLRAQMPKESAEPRPVPPAAAPPARAPARPPAPVPVPPPPARPPAPAPPRPAAPPPPARPPARPIAPPAAPAPRPPAPPMPVAPRPPASGPGPECGQLSIARWGNPQLTPSGVLKLPVVFKDEATGMEYNTTIVIQLNPLVPCK